MAAVVTVLATAVVSVMATAVVRVAVPVAVTVVVVVAVAVVVVVVILDQPQSSGMRQFRQSPLTGQHPRKWTVQQLHFDVTSTLSCVNFASQSTDRSHSLPTGIPPVDTGVQASEDAYTATNTWSLERTSTTRTNNHQMPPRPAFGVIGE